MKNRFIPTSHHPFLVVPLHFFCLFEQKEDKKEIHKESCRRNEKKNGAEPKGKKPKKLQFEIHMANKIYGKLYCGRSCSCEGEKEEKKERKKVRLASGARRKFMLSLRFYSFGNVLEMLHIFSHFDFYRDARCFALTLVSFYLLMYPVHSWHLFMEKLFEFVERRRKSKSFET